MFREPVDGEGSDEDYDVFPFDPKEATDPVEVWCWPSSRSLCKCHILCKVILPYTIDQKTLTGSYFSHTEEGLLLPGRASSWYAEGKNSVIIFSHSHSFNNFNMIAHNC